MRDDERAALCREVGAQLRQLAEQRAAGEVSEEAFVQAVLCIEEEQLRRNGIAVTASNTIDDWTVFTLKMESGERCAAFEFLPETGEFREVGSGPRSRRAEALSAR